jgi:subtilase family serine protease
VGWRMQRLGFGARGRSWHLGVGVAVAFVLAGMLAVLAVSADAGTATPRLASVQRAAATPVGAQALGAPASDASQTGYVVLKPRDEQSLKSFIASVTKLHSSQYHQYLKAGQFAAKFGPSSSAIAAVKSQLSADGLTVTSVARDGLLIGFSGTTTKVESAFGTALERYKSAAGITGEQTTKAISLPSKIASDVTAVIGLNTLVHPEANLIRAPKSAYASHKAAKTANFAHPPGAPDACADASSAATTFGGLTDDQIANAYGATPLYAAGDTGAGVSIGVYELEPYSSTDLQTFDQCYFGSNSTPGGITNKTVDGGQPAGSGSGESILDIEDVAAMAPGAHIDVYEAPNNSAGSLDDYAQMVNDDTDQIITSSWGFCEQDEQLADPGAQQAEDYIFQQAAAQGQTVLSAAGDTGDDTCNEVRSVPPPTDQNPLSVEDPASQPYVLAVGGTTIQDADPSHYDETVWNDGASWGGGGGGFSMSWEAPSWQQTALGFPQPGSADYTNANSVETGADQPPLDVSNQSWPAGFCQNNTAAGFSSTTPCRTLPDVSAQADEFTGAVTIYSASFGAGASGWITIGGTSSATPIWAAMLALVDASSTCPAPVANVAPGIGFAVPLLYAVAANGPEYAASFHDITVGNNDVYGLDDGTVFPATTGYDLATGLGSPILAGAGATPGLAHYLCALATGTTATPHVSDLTPTVGSIAGGGTLTVGGSGFEPVGGATVQSVTIGADVIPASGITVNSNNSLTVTALPPAVDTLAPGNSSITDPDTGTTYVTGGSTTGQDGAGVANVVVTMSDGTSSPIFANSNPNYDQYTYVDEVSAAPVPSVSSISPYAGVNTGDTNITIYGSGFTAGDTVTVGGTAATGVNVVSPWEIKATTPAYNSSGCVTNAALDTELGIATSIDQSVSNICQTEVVVTDSGAHSSATTAPLPTYLGVLPSATEDGLLEVPTGYEITPVPDEFDYVPAPTITDVGAINTPDGDANGDPGAYGVASDLAITGTGLNYQTLDWFSFGDPTTTNGQDISYPSYADGTNVEIDALPDPNGTPASGSDSDSAVVTADTLGGRSNYDPPCTVASNDCLTYAGIPAVSSVTAEPLGINAAPDTGGTSLVIGGHGLDDVVGPLEFTDAFTPFSAGTQYQYTAASDTQIDTQTVSQNPAIVDTYACSDSGCSAQNGGDELLLFPPGDPVITSIQDASGPPAGGTLVTINGENIGCVTGISFGGTAAVSASQSAALLDCGSTTQVTVVAPPGTAGQSVPITLTTVESEVTGAPDATSLAATSGPTEFTYDATNPSVTSALAFGSVNLASSGTQTVTISNPGSATQPLYPEPTVGATPYPASIGGADAGDFRIGTDSCVGATVSPGASCTIQVQFAPTALGSRSATLDIPWNQSASVSGSQTADFSVSLSGTGTEPTKTVTTPGRTKTCTITVRWRWVTVKVHGKKKREHKKFTTRSKGCKKRAKKAKPSRKHRR